jgi:hypothetical protein
MYRGRPLEGQRQPTEVCANEFGAPLEQTQGAEEIAKEKGGAVGTRRQN